MKIFMILFRLLFIAIRENAESPIFEFRDLN